jgi:hypothetical protein
MEKKMVTTFNLLGTIPFNKKITIFYVPNINFFHVCKFFKNFYHGF